MAKLKRVFSVRDILTTKYNIVDFDGAWKDFCGQPELSGCWIIYGESGNGKTSFAMQLAKYLMRWEKVWYNSLEEGKSRSIERVVIRNKMEEGANSFHLLHKIPMVDLYPMLHRKHSPNVVFIDSLQYMNMKAEEVKELVDTFPNKLFIFISHANKGEPNGATAMAVKFHANVKIQVAGYKAYAASRYSDGSTTVPYVIWEQGAAEFDRQKSKKNNNDDTKTSRESMED